MGVYLFSCRGAVASAGRLGRMVMRGLTAPGAGRGRLGDEDTRMLGPGSELFELDP
jgi:hypothetical protein